ncbi:MAG: sulfurtransferase TusA family protein, partial [Fretibacterium sp.]
MITVNAVGKACPEPVIMTRAAVEKGAVELEILVDNAVAVSNVTRFLEGQGFRVQHQENGETRDHSYVPVDGPLPEFYEP